MSTDERLRAASIAACPDQGERPPVLPGAVFGDIVQVSGQTAVGPTGELLETGILGADLDLAAGRRCAWQCAVNVLQAARQQIGSLTDIAGVRMVQVLVAATPDFTEHHLVADAASECFLEVLGADVGRHTRVAVGVSSLPTGSPVEVVATLQLQQPLQPQPGNG